MENQQRRKFIKDSLKLSLGLAAASSAMKPLSVFAGTEDKADAFQFSQVALPYSYDALSPYIDALTMEIHYTKHHTTYIKNVNEAIAAEHLTFKNATDFFAGASKLSAKARNNGGGAWNHNFFWQIMKPGSSAEPTGKLADAINGTFGSSAKFKELFTQAAIGRFGSGWAWLVDDHGTLRIGSTPNQDNPLMDIADVKGTPILGLDVWEHAYYLKYQNKRNEYIAAWWNTVNWEAAAKHLV